ncbi:23S rRNA (uracil(747)-C(5))-methyltransferase RlmC [Vibrio fluvialis]|uniref:23S rRNA (uracil(747)-C(5))-methyltransferase RlmC n=1 Tax=Vibrio fluvialis TaxID=676 RepID=UPI00192BF7BB|nr:23S rRNA (uracil(747)-C(5))-methyltransferase RlmC [Vibrio fluvialis]MBL4283734.1 23S rRNA (uracil(747)-C(5))-methyltransferase RlmC [Vibrio fluvialis]MBY7996210.1 23S rRNA (uracil(747)-C(5))-methyltransferase RlmC [Vibrio fluvialis]MBY8103324.1 23S rRNA (uracil(747)-C(5))-methyltransferase RlmC [Vibrio fluvialis]
MHCEFFEQQRCTSCTHCATPYVSQVEIKDSHLKDLLVDLAPQQWLPPMLSEETAFRNKAKMVVLGAAHAPILGIESQLDGEALSLTQCPLYPAPTQALLEYLQQWIRIAGIPPYNKAKKKGELKFILLTRSEHTGQFMLRFVSRSKDVLPRIERSLPALLEAFPAIEVVSVNIQPVHMARLEGDEEIFLTDTQVLMEQFNDVPMVIRPKSFFQTNPQVAASLYATARQWVRELDPAHMWDLFCGVGGFALHCASPSTAVTGIEIEPEAIASAKRSASAMGIDNLSFAALDSAQFSLGQDAAPDLVLVNPPRRGLGQALTKQLAMLAPKHIIYSSCNPLTMKSDMEQLSDYRSVKLQWFDMFPHTDHAEVLVLLERKA